MGLNYTDNFTLLVAVVPSAQSTDKQVNETTEKFVFFLILLKKCIG